MGQFSSKVKVYNQEAKQGKRQFQSFKPVFRDFGIQFMLEAKKIPEKYFECGKLEINLKIPFTNDYQNLVLVRMSSLPSRVVTKNWIFKKYLENDLMIELCLKNTDKDWNTTIHKEMLPLKANTSSHCVEFPCGLELEITINEKEPDIKVLNVEMLCSEESAFVTARTNVVLQKMRGCRVPFRVNDPEDVPNIAIIGSGGGLRAVIGMSAAMTALKENDITDYAMYTAGLSGSAWYLLTLYANDDFNPTAVKKKIRKNLHNFNGTLFRIIMMLFVYYVKGYFFNYGRSQIFANLFGEKVSRVLLLEECTNLWSHRANLLNNGTVPCPLVAALHIRNEIKSKDHNEWIEFSPYQVFMPMYGSAINMTHFGKQFYGGFCTGRYNEKPIAFLQGMCGSAYTIGRDFLPSGKTRFMSWRCIRMVIRFLFYILDEELVAKVPSFLFGIAEFTEEQDFYRWVICMLSPIFSYAWGVDRTEFEYQVDLVDVNDEEMKLVDAGIAFNSPYPTILRPSREVELILSFDFSERKNDKEDPFKELIKAEEWARKKDIKFPNIQSKLKDIEIRRGTQQYDELYIFEDTDTPTIMHFVLVNNSYRSNGNDFDIFPAYRTLKFDYPETKFNMLHDLVRHNVVTNVSKIDMEIRKTINKREERQNQILLDNQNNQIGANQEEEGRVG